MLLIIVDSRHLFALIAVKHLICVLILRRNMAITFKTACDKLHCDHLLLFPWIRNALVILSTLEGELLVIAVFLLLDKLLDKLLTVHLLGIVKVLGLTLLLVAYG